MLRPLSLPKCLHWETLDETLPKTQGDYIGWFFRDLLVPSAELHATHQAGIAPTKPTVTLISLYLAGIYPAATQAALSATSHSTK